jgi:SEC-C motif-containing protein
MSKKPSPNAPCPCGKKVKLKRCCLALINGRPAPTPETLMRSRYVAYLLGRATYIVETTHPDGPQFHADREQWLAQITEFCRATTFVGLSILATSDQEPDQSVHFRATLIQDGQDASFSERSLFRRHDGQWKYLGPSDHN